MIDNKQGELTLVFNSEKPDDRKARGYVESLPSVVIKTLDLSKEAITETQLAQLSDKLGIPVTEMVDPTYDDTGNAGNKVRVLKEMEGQELLILLAHNTRLLATPILIVGNKAYKFASSYELINQYQALGVKSSAAANTQERESE